jgi:hypothetical protein
MNIARLDIESHQRLTASPPIANNVDDAEDCDEGGRWATDFSLD